MLPFYEIRQGNLTVKHNMREIHFPVHMHSYIEILYMFEGKQHIKIEGVSYTISEGEVVVIFPDTVHNFYKTTPSNASGLLIMCEPKLLASIMPNLCDLRPINPKISKKDTHANLVHALESIKPNDKFELKLAWTCVIMAYIMESLCLYQHERMPVQDMAHKIVKYIGENFKESITRKSLAKAFNVNEYYISRLFSERLKVNLRTYLGWIRADYATTLIRSSDDTLITISQAAGFDSIRTFNRVFGVMHGMSPKEYRNKIKQ